MARQRVKLVVCVDLDPLPGIFHTKESAEEAIRFLLSNIEHYRPTVRLADDQPYLEPKAP